MVEGVAWQVDLRTGQNWPLISDTEMSEVEVEEEVREVEGNSLSAAREVIRAEVRQTCFFHLALGNIYT